MQVRLGKVWKIIEVFSVGCPLPFAGPGWFDWFVPQKLTWQQKRLKNSANLRVCYWKWPIYSWLTYYTMVIFQSCVSLPEGIPFSMSFANTKFLKIRGIPYRHLSHHPIVLNNTKYILNTSPWQKNNGQLRPYYLSSTRAESEAPWWKHRETAARNFMPLRGHGHRRATDLAAMAHSEWIKSMAMFYRRVIPTNIRYIYIYISADIC